MQTDHFQRLCAFALCFLLTRLRVNARNISYPCFRISFNFPANAPLSASPVINSI